MLTLPGAILSALDSASVCAIVDQEFGGLETDAFRSEYDSNVETAQYDEEFSKMDSDTAASHRDDSEIAFSKEFDAMIVAGLVLVCSKEVGIVISRSGVFGDQCQHRTNCHCFALD